MPPRSQKTVTEWHQCLKCHLTVHTKELSKHKQECSSNKPLSSGFVTSENAMLMPCLFPEGLFTLTQACFTMVCFYIVFLKHHFYRKEQKNVSTEFTIAYPAVV